jgi:hypothetical protein
MEKTNPDLQDLKKFLMVVVIGVSAAWASSEIVLAELEKHRLAGKCVAKLVDLGFERSNIRINGENCYLITQMTHEKEF